MPQIKMKTPEGKMPLWEKKVQNEEPVLNVLNPCEMDQSSKKPKMSHNGYKVLQHFSLQRASLYGISYFVKLGKISKNHDLLFENTSSSAWIVCLLALVMEIGEGNETMSKGSNFRIDCPWNPEEDFFELFSISY